LLVTSQYKLFTRILIAFQELRSKGSSNPMSPMSLQSYQSNSSNQSSSNQPTATTKSLPNPWSHQSTPQTQEESPKTAKKIPDPKVSLLLNKSKAKKAKAIYEYEANEDNEISFKEDDIITIIEEVPDSQWWKGECKGSIGLFPNNYVEIIAEVDNSSEKQRKEAEELRKQQEEAEKKRLEEIARKKKQDEEFKKKQEEDKKRREETERKIKEEEEKRKRDEELKKKQQSVPSKVSTPSKTMIKALFDFDANEVNELSFKENDILVLIEKPEDSDWWKGELNGKQGLFPSNYVEVIKETAPVKIPVVPSKPKTPVVASKPKYKANFDYDAQEVNELSFKENDIITLIEKVPDSDWWKGELNGKQGLFPSNFTDPI